MTVQFGQLSSRMFANRQSSSQGTVYGSVQIGPQPVQDPNNLFCGDDTNSMGLEGTLSAGDAFVVKYTNMQGGVLAEVTANANPTDPTTVQFKLHPTAGRLLTDRMTDAEKTELAQDTLSLKSKLKQVLSQLTQATPRDTISLNTENPDQSTVIQINRE